MGLGTIHNENEPTNVKEVIAATATTVFVDFHVSVELSRYYSL